MQFVLEGCPPSKDRIYGPKEQRVGIDEGVSTIARSSNGHTDLKELAPGCERDARQVRCLARAMDRSRRATNPDNYNPDGTVRKGKKKWVMSKHYLKLQGQHRDVCRREKAKRRQEHEILANETLAMGGTIIVEPMKIQALAKRSKQTTRNRHGHCNSKKRYGKTIGNRAPAEFITILERKAGYANFTVNRVDAWDFKASQYDHATGTYTKKALKDRIIEVGGHLVQRDMYSSFLLEHARDDKAIDQDACIRDFPDFVRSCQKEVADIRARGDPYLLWYVT